MRNSFLGAVMGIRPALDDGDGEYAGFGTDRLEAKFSEAGRRSQALRLASQDPRYCGTVQ